MKKTLSLAVLALAAGLTGAQTLTWSVEPRGVAIAADAAENVFTVDWDFNPGGDITLTKTAPNGVRLFSVRHDNTDPTRHEVATWVVTDSGGGAYVSGTSRSGYSNPVDANGLLMRFGADGTLRWRLVLGSDFDGGSTLRVLRDADDNAYVLGIGPTPSGVRMRIHKVSPAGTLLWMWHDFAGVGAPTNLKWGADGNLVVAARAPTGLVGGFARVDKVGQTLFLGSGIPAYAGVDTTADAAGRLIAVSLDPATGQGRLVRYGAYGSIDWQRSDPVNMSRVEMTPDGGVLVSGTPTAGSFGVAFLRYDASGNLLWANRDADGAALALFSHGQMRVDAAGNGYLAAGNGSQMAVTRVNADGSTGWTVLAPFGGGVALDFGVQTQAVYVVGGQTARIDQGGSPPPPPPPPAVPDLTVGLVDSPDPARPNASITFTTTVRNLGTGAAAGVTLLQQQNVALSVLQASTTQGSCTSLQPLRCSLGTLAPGASVTVTQVVRTRSTGSFGTTATVATTTAEPVTANNSATQTTTVRRR